MDTTDRSSSPFPSITNLSSLFKPILIQKIEIPSRQVCKHFLLVIDICYKFARERIDCLLKRLLGIEGDVVSCLYEIVLAKAFSVISQLMPRFLQKNEIDEAIILIILNSCLLVIESLVLVESLNPSTSTFLTICLQHSSIDY